MIIDRVRTAAVAATASLSGRLALKCEAVQGLQDPDRPRRCQESGLESESRGVQPAPVPTVQLTAFRSEQVTGSLIGS